MLLQLTHSSSKLLLYQSADKKLKCQLPKNTIISSDLTIDSFYIVNVQIVKDELQALQLAYSSLEEKHRKLQEDNQDLVSL